MLPEMAMLHAVLTSCRPDDNLELLPFRPQLSNRQYLWSTVRMSLTELPPLPYDYSGLEPYIDATTMSIHHGKHHATYVNNVKAALEKFPELKDLVG